MSKSTRYAVVALSLLLLGLLVAAGPPGQAAIKAALFLLQVLPSTPLHPLTWITPQPVRERVVFPHQGRQITADIYRPPNGSHPGAVVVLGFNVDLADPTVSRTLDALARLNMVIMVPFAEVLFGQLDPGQPEVFVSAFHYLRQQDFVQNGRVGFLGFSVGSSLAAIAAADPRIREDVAFLNWFGGYDHLPNLLTAILAREIVVEGQTVPWKPSPHVLEHLTQGLVQTVPKAQEQRMLERIFLEGQPATQEQVQALSPEGQRVYHLLSASSRTEVHRALAQFPEPIEADLAQLSPGTHAAGILAPTFVLHDTGDQFVPYTESRQFWERLPAASRGSYTEVALFEHMTPQQAEGLGVFLRETGKLYGHLYRLLRTIDP